MSIATTSGHRFGMLVRSITSGLHGTVIGITQCIAGCELLEVKTKDSKNVTKTHVFSSKLVEIVNSDKVDEYEAIFAKTNTTMPIRLGDEVEDTVSEAKGIVTEIQYSVNEAPNVLMVKPYSEHETNIYASARVISCKKTGHSIHDKILNNRNKRERDELKVELLQKARCMATGAEGLVTAVFNQANGTVSVGIQPVSKEGRLLDTHYTDIELVEIITEEPKKIVQPEKAKLKKSGCMRSHELSSMQRRGMHTV
ncbi:hypothetical protein VPFG_00206 [Vibrio phage nt-1]|uniref:Uncharacterized protein n=1 Tax=Vibrio phage nt-1 TaxID=115992 RepID=R9TEL9_9CAUD|nr:hypothetical protein VPFG_00206 [Vibrio phage nt-1]AGN30206.1 hypothetical protein VPFG_00206 [Vibrio phage nt-1]